MYIVRNNTTGKSYVGIAKESAARRWKNHKYLARKGSKSAFHSAIRKYGEDNFTVTHLVTSTWGDYLKELERRAIGVFRTLSPAGYNLTVGGDGVTHMIGEVRERIKIGRALNPPRLTESGRKSISDGNKLVWAREGEKEARGLKIKQALSDPIVHQKRCTAISKTASTARGRKLKSDIMNALWKDESYRIKTITNLKAALSTPEAKLNRSKAAKAAWAKRKAVKNGN